ncbi:hypothetical protein [Pararhodobacter marinus]|uniref:Cytochrome C oxidase assembly protein n=1 Tax=Pararhodobacter marinus TaxID=2184063 RepID=A0A2U2C7R3_9RHOB|nr:hypothetical protein [Pararhodobacter marinus]PWE27936.1 hypothetical protein C4N9_13850 [Pararhodobacter marinus]
MALTREHDLHKRRQGRNIGVLVVLLAFVALVFGLTIAKMTTGDQLQGFDHTYRIEMDPGARTGEAGQ